MGGVGVVKIYGKLELPFHFCNRQGRAQATQCMQYLWPPEQQHPIVEFQS